MSHTEIAKAFLTMAASGRVREAYEAYVDKRFKHHNGHFRGDADSLRKGMEDDARAHPDKHLEVIHTIGDGNLVALHSRVTTPDEYALVHIFRFEGDRIAELWDIAQPVPKNSPNANGMF